MKKYTIIILSLFSISLSAYVPMKKIKNKYFKEDICKFSDADYDYVKPCDEGKYCETYSDIGYCKKVEDKIKLKTLNEDCTSDFDCESNLICKSNKCSRSSNCGSDESLVKFNFGWACIKNDEKGLCYKVKEDDSSYLYNNGPEYFQVCGKITFYKYAETGDNIEYKPLKIESTYMGTVDDGEFVLDEKACKSGYALYFYADGSLIDPGKNTYTNQMYKKCVSINEFDKRDSACVIKYDNDKIYNVGKLSGKQTIDSDCNPIYISTTSGGEIEYLCDDPLVKKEMWNKYINLYNSDKQKECEKNTDIEDPLTCDDNEIRKWLYFLTKPQEYIAYYDDEEEEYDVINYLLQNHYKVYISSGFLTIKFIAFLLILLISF